MTAADPYTTSATLPARRTDAPGPPQVTRAGHDSGAAPPAPATSGTHQVVTGEAVALDLAPASVLSRLMSGLIDVIVYLSFGAAVLVLATRFATNDAQLGTMTVIALAGTMVILPTTVETLTRGLSAGRLAVGLRIVREDGGPIRFRHALIRSLAGIGEIWLTLGSVAVITAIVHPRAKRLGDLVAGTYSLRVRETEISRAPLLMPPELGEWAASADIGRLPDTLALRARVYLSRTGELHPQIRAQAARTFAAALEPYVAPPPPWGTDPERFIAAVLVARRDREYLAGLASAEREQAEAQRARMLPFGITDSP